MEYPKTENLWVRDPETHLMSPANGYRHHGFEQVDSWLVLEKIDGMNMRVIWDTVHEDVTLAPAIYGRTDRAQIPGDLMAHMEATFTSEALIEAFGRFDDETDELLLPRHVVLFGEGYGPGIQQGGHYSDSKSFTLFDVVVCDRWQDWAEVERIASVLGVETPPVLGRGMDTYNVQNLVAMMMDGPVLPRQWGCATDTPEGIIARTDPYLFDGYGRRIMFKHKVRDVKSFLEVAS
jgi:hypothetical protein